MQHALADLERGGWVTGVATSLKILKQKTEEMKREKEK